MGNHIANHLLLPLRHAHESILNAFTRPSKASLLRLDLKVSEYTELGISVL